MKIVMTNLWARVVDKTEEEHLWLAGYLTSLDQEFHDEWKTDGEGHRYQAPVGVDVERTVYEEVDGDWGFPAGLVPVIRRARRELGAVEVEDLRECPWRGEEQ